jgi:hypothetical protein
MASLLIEIKRAVDNLKDKGLSAMANSDIEEYIARHNDIMVQGMTEDAAKKFRYSFKKDGETDKK